MTCECWRRLWLSQGGWWKRMKSDRRQVPHPKPLSPLPGQSQSELLKLHLWSCHCPDSKPSVVPHYPQKKIKTLSWPSKATPGCSPTLQHLLGCLVPMPLLLSFPLPRMPSPFSFTC